MNWTEVTVKTTTEAVEAISNILLEERCGGVMIEDPKDFLFQEKNELDWDYVEEEVFNKSNQDGVLIKTYIPEERNVLELVETIKAKISLLPDCGLDIGEGSVSLSNVNESDWANEWKKYYKPTKIGQKIVVKPTWEDYEVKEGDLVIELDPGMAFGTGTHETTSMCIEALQDIVFEGDEVLDIGCGSGILSVTALLCGANRADATDIDRNAVNVAYENAELNGVKDRLHATEDNILSAESPIRTAGKKYNVVIANIVADVIIEICGFVKTLIKPYGCFVASGIISERLDDVVKAMNDNGLCVAAIHEKRGWNCIIANPDTEDSV